MGKTRDGKKGDDEHVSRPLATLKDPSSFGPPPKNVNYHGGAALPNEITPHTSGWGAPLTQEQIQSANQVANRSAREEAEEESRPAGPPLPYRADKTGLKTDHLPPPPIHRDVNRGLEQAEPGPARPKPGLPPRLPSRQDTASSTPPPRVTSPTPSVAPPAYDSIPIKEPSPPPSSNYGINQTAVNKLGNAGISVPALGIGSNQSSNPWQNGQSQTTQPKSPSTNPQPSNQLSELQARFARMNSDSNVTQQNNSPPLVTPAQSPPPVTAPTQATPPPSYQQPQQAPAQGTTWAEKQAALRTASNMQKDPSSVTMSDASSAARTANTFRERHQDSINAAGARASEWNKKYNVTGRLNSFLEKHSSPTTEDPPQQLQQQPGAVGVNTSAQVQLPPAHQPQQPTQPPQSPEITASISRKPPPPPPPKKPANMHGSINSSAGTTSPPPVPLGTKPSYS